MIKTSPHFLNDRRIRQFLIGIAVIQLIAVLVPIMGIFGSWYYGVGTSWTHLWQNQLVGVWFNSLLLVSCVGFCTLILGTSLAWCTTQLEFFGRKFFERALLLPLALPTYVLGFVYVALLDYSGPVMGFMRTWGLDFFDDIFRIRSFTGLVFVLSLSLYPYVYLGIRHAFMSQGGSCIAAARVFGHGHLSTFFRVSLPLSFPWLVASIALVMMEVLADFGTSQIFSVETATTTIYRVWFGLFDFQTAAQMASILLLTILPILLLGQSAKDSLKRTAIGSALTSEPLRFQVTFWTQFMIFAACFAVLILGFVLPMSQLLIWAIFSYTPKLMFEHLRLVLNTIEISGLVASCVTVMSFFIVAARRFSPWLGALRLARSVSRLGYAIPGTVMAVAVFAPFAYIDQLIAIGRTWFKNGFYSDPQEATLILTGTIAMMVFSLFVRFFAVGEGVIHAAQLRISSTLDDASMSMGVPRGKFLMHVFGPLLRPALASSFALCFVDVAKEMPLTVMTRVFGWDTLSVRIFELTSEGEWHQAAFSALCLGLLGLIPVWILSSFDQHRLRS